MERHAFGFRLAANAPEGRRRLWWQLPEDAVYAKRSLR